MSLGFMLCQKEMFWAHQSSCLILLGFNSGWQPTKHKPTWLAVQIDQNKRTPNNLHFSFLSLSEDSFSAQHERLKEEKESLSKLQKECTAKRCVSNHNAQENDLKA